ncbi:MAG: helix-turn-helix domain-containing protein [Proteobacteria bacterium]|nr:helix-turn-helix domain-containing protein [Pseudomonadota bacterium]
MPAAGQSAGGLIRQARQAQGLHIAALAAAIKVTPRKLEMLEADRFDELPDATFTRALAGAVCRHLKVPPGPVLALLPPPSGQERLEQVAEGLKMPFREHGDRMAAERDLGWLASPLVWGPALLVIGLVAIYLVPTHWTFLRTSVSGAASAPANVAAAASTPLVAEAAAASEPAAAASQATLAEAAPVPPPAAATDSTPPPAVEPAASGVVQLQASADSWVGVTDATGRSLVSRTIKAGEDIDLDGTPPFKVTIGNARDTKLTYRGKPVDLGTRDNVARLELK